MERKDFFRRCGLQTKVMRFVKITFTVEDEGERKIMVESVASDR